MSATLERRLEALERDGNMGDVPLVIGWRHGDDVRSVALAGQRFERMEGESVEELKERAVRAISENSDERTLWMKFE